MDEAVAIAIANVDEGGIDTGQDILDHSEVDVADLMRSLGDNEFLDLIVFKNSGDAMLFGNNNLFGH
jgi:hypothetical protein